MTLNYGTIHDVRTHLSQNRASGSATGGINRPADGNTLPLKNFVTPTFNKGQRLELGRIPLTRLPGMPFHKRFGRMVVKRKPLSAARKQIAKDRSRKIGKGIAVRFGEGQG